MRFVAFLVTALCLMLPLTATAGGQDDVNKQLNRGLQVLSKHPNDMAALRDVSLIYLNRADFNNAIKYGLKLQTLAYDAQDYHNFVIYSHFILGEAYTMKGDKTTAYNNLMQAEMNAKSAKKDSALCSVYNGLGLYSMNMLGDNYRALTYFYKGLDVAKRCRNDRLYTTLLSNISVACCLKRDTTGLKYALECHEKALSRGDNTQLFYSAASAANLYLLKGNLTLAQRYIDEAARAAQEQQLIDRSPVQNINGMIALRRGNPQLATSFFANTIATKTTNSVGNSILGYLGYGQAMTMQRRYTEAINAYNDGIRLSADRHNAAYLRELLQSLSTCYEQMGNKTAALACYKRFRECTDSMYNAEKERTISDLRIKYDIEKQENELRQNQLKLLQTRNRMQVMLGILAFAVVTSTLLYILYRRKNMLYKAIVKQNREAIRREQALQQRLDSYANPDRQATHTITDSRKQDLYDRLEELMTERKIYRDKLITKEKVADMLGSNRTYLSQVINEQTGLTFTSFIGSLRIKEAVEVLSDPKSDTPIKALCSDVGFSSMTTFYNLFRQTTGMTPAAYRAKVMEMASE